MNNWYSLLIAILILAGTFFVAGKVHAIEYRDVTIEDLGIYEDDTIYELEVEDEDGGLFWYAIEIQMYRNFVTLNNSLDDDPDTWVAGYAEWRDDPDNPDYEICTIHMVHPSGWNDAENIHTLGHEILHCFEAAHMEIDNEKTRNQNSQRGYQIS